MSLFAMDSSFTRAARSPFGPPSAFGRYAPRRWNDGIGVRGSQQNGFTVGRHHSRTSAAWRQAATALVRDSTVFVCEVDVPGCAKIHPALLPGRR